ncbi:MAG TPA: hypothetical protein VH880_11025 [Anaeromyxobacteraceae bacterium]
MKRLTCRAAAAIVIFAAASRADAIPAFARKTGMSCTGCHTAWPLLNQVGQNFRDEGYQFNLGKDEPNTLPPAYVPLAVRTFQAYEMTRATNQESAGGPVTATAGGVPFGGIDILAAGTVARDISYLVVLAGFVDGEPGAVESGWLRFNRIRGSPWFNVKVGKLELDQPASSHRPIAHTVGFAAYDPFPFSSVGFAMGDNQVGVEVDGHNARSSTRYAISLTSANGAEGMSRGLWSAPTLYGHLQHSYDLGNETLRWVRVGVLGSVGWWPTAFYADPAGDPIPGTGTAHKRFTRLGGDLSFILGNPATPAHVTLAFIRGQEEAGLGGVDPAGLDLSLRSNSFNGGFAELAWVPWAEDRENATPWVLFARVDAVRYQRGAGDLTGFTAGARHYVALGPRASAAIHLEVHADQVKDTGAPDPLSGQPRNVDSLAVVAGVDFAF